MTTPIPARDILRELLTTHGPQGWWPVETPLEMVCGAILIQNTRWRGGEIALENLLANAATPQAIISLSDAHLQGLIKPAGFMRAKAAALKALSRWILDNDAFAKNSPVGQWDVDTLRKSLLGVRGVGPETADVICMYAFGRPCFVWSTYARRLLTRRGYGDLESRSYEQLRRDPAMCADMSGMSLADAQELHALIVREGQS